jgi:hypothetical protein
MSTKLNFGRDVQGYNAYAPVPSTNMYSATLANGVASTITLPTNSPAWIVSFSAQPGTNIWVCYTGATAAIPAAGTFAATTSELNPGARLLPSLANDGVTAKTLSIITDSTTSDVSVVLYAAS